MTMPPPLHAGRSGNFSCVVNEEYHRDADSSTKCRQVAGGKGHPRFPVVLFILFMFNRASWTQTFLLPGAETATEKLAGTFL